MAVKKKFGRLTKQRVFRVSSREALTIQRRVLRLVNSYLSAQKQDLLVAGGGGLMTWGEIRQHVQECLRLKVKS